MIAIKRVITVILILGILAGFMVGCGGDSNKLTDKIFSREKVSFLNESGESVYRVIRPLNCEDVLPALQTVHNGLESKLNIQIK
ncbi:MAG: hypothetical protein IIX60_00450, partial [Clostridia bacterium]|nr:hypothetical protein [Clostridia bacterium]